MPPNYLARHTMNHFMRTYFFLVGSLPCHRNCLLILSILLSIVTGILYTENFSVAYEKVTNALKVTMHLHHATMHWKDDYLIIYMCSWDIICVYSKPFLSKKNWRTMNNIRSLEPYFHMTYKNTNFFRVSLCQAKCKRFRSEEHTSELSHAQ